MADGKGCVCNAHGECECACDADWTPQELIDARAEMVRLRAASSKRLDEIAADMPRWKTLTLLQQLRDKGPAMKCVPMFAVKAMRHAASMIESYQQHDAELETACHQSELDYQAKIERLRLTDDEIEAITDAIWAFGNSQPVRHCQPKDLRRAYTLRAMLARHRAIGSVERGE